MTEYLYEKGSLKVSRQFLITRYRDESLTPVESVIVGREPLWLSLVIGSGLMAFALNFHDLLYAHEHIILFFGGLGMIVAGYCCTNLKMGRFGHEKTVLWSTIWTTRSVRRAIADAKSSSQSNDTQRIVISDIGE